MNKVYVGGVYINGEFEDYELKDMGDVAVVHLYGPRRKYLKSYVVEKPLGSAKPFTSKREANRFAKQVAKMYNVSIEAVREEEEDDPVLEFYRNSQFRKIYKQVKEEALQGVELLKDILYEEGVLHSKEDEKKARIPLIILSTLLTYGMRYAYETHLESTFRGGGQPWHPTPIEEEYYYKLSFDVGVASGDGVEDEDGERWESADISLPEIPGVVFGVEATLNDLYKWPEDVRIDSFETPYIPREKWIRWAKKVL